MFDVNMETSQIKIIRIFQLNKYTKISRMQKLLGVTQKKMIKPNRKWIDINEFFNFFRISLFYRLEIIGMIKRPNILLGGPL